MASKVVPGAPPPASKSQKKKRRAGAGKADDGTSTPASASVGLPDTHAAALTETAPTDADVQKGAVADELLVHDDKGEVQATKSSPIAELLNKRLKNVGKKISRIESYSSKPASELNEDQKKTLLTLPGLEAVRKELEETKKAVEALEVEQSREMARIRTEAEAAEKTRLLEELANSQAEHAVRTAKVLDFIRLHSMLTASDPSIQALNLVEAEINAIFASVNALMAQESETKHEVLRGFLHGEGDIEGIAYGRLLEILDAFSNPTPRDEIEQVAEAVVDALIDSVPRPPAAEGLGPSAAGTSLNFMAESELDDDPVAFDTGAEFVERDIPHEPEETILTVEVGTVVVPVEPTGQTPVDGGLNWAEDEGELPSIDGLHAAFGTSGTATPSSATAPAKPETQNVPPEPTRAAPNGHATSAPDSEGFVTYRGGNRGRARGGRGGGGQHNRGGHTGESGGFRGRGFRGRGRGKSDGDWRGHEGERGRGGRGHRGHRGGRGGGGGDGPPLSEKAA